VNDVVADYLKAYRALLWHFNCRQDYLVRSMIGYNWAIICEEDAFFLEYWRDGGEKSRAVAVRQDDAPMVYPAREYTLVVAIDCVKIGFILETWRQDRSIMMQI